MAVTHFEDRFHEPDNQENKVLFRLPIEEFSGIKLKFKEQDVWKKILTESERKLANGERIESNLGSRRDLVVENKSIE